MPVALSFLSSALTAVIAAFIAAFLATRRTKSETRWKAKYDAYTRILGSLEDIRYWAEETYASNMLLPAPSQGQLDQAAQRYEEAKRLLWSYVHVGALVVCDEVRTRLDSLLGSIATEEFRYHEESHDDADYSQYLAAHCDNVRKLIAAELPVVVDAAARDLR